MRKFLKDIIYFYIFSGCVYVSMYTLVWESHSVLFFSYNYYISITRICVIHTCTYTYIYTHWCLVWEPWYVLFFFIKLLHFVPTNKTDCDFLFFCQCGIFSILLKNTLINMRFCLKFFVQTLSVCNQLFTWILCPSIILTLMWNFPKNSCSFIVNMSSILIPQDTSPTFAALYEDCLGEPNDFEAVAFYGDFTRLVNTRLMTPTMQQQVVDYFWISLHQIQPLILCVLKHSLKIQTSKKLQQKEELKITTNLLYEHVVKTAMTKRWHSNSLKKMTTCKVTYLVKADNFWDGVKMENSLMASLPPIHEINTQMYEELLTALEHRRQAEADFVFEVLPSYVDKIKL